MEIVYKHYPVNSVKPLSSLFNSKIPFSGKVKTLSALNLDGNPLTHPPFEIIKQGIKSIQQYLRDNLQSSDDSSISSDNDQDPTPRFTSHHPLHFSRKSKYFNRFQIKVKSSQKNN